MELHPAPQWAEVVKQGSPGDAMYLIDLGKVRISITDADGHIVTLAELGPGEFFGEMSMLDSRGRSASATVMQDARLAMAQNIGGSGATVTTHILEAWE